MFKLKYPKCSNSGISVWRKFSFPPISCTFCGAKFKLNTKMAMFVSGVGTIVGPLILLIGLAMFGNFGFVIFVGLLFAIPISLPLQKIDT